MDRLIEIWRYPIFTFADGAIISISQIVFSIGFVIIGLILSSWVARFSARHFRNARIGVDAVNTIQKIVFYLLVLVFFLTALRILHIPLTALTFMSGAVAIGVGFGAQNIINNFISGWVLMSERPVRVGDFVEIDDSKGVIEDVGNRCTRIRRTDGVHLLVPNSMMLERIVVNWTLIDKIIRTQVRVGVSYGSPARKVANLIAQAIEENSMIRETPEVQIVFDDFGDNALVFEALFWCEVGGERDLRGIRSDLRHRIDELFRESNIVIAYPQRDVHLDVQNPVEIKITR